MVDPDEMPDSVTFHQGLVTGAEICTICLEINMFDPSIHTMDFEISLKRGKRIGWSLLVGIKLATFTLNLSKSKIFKCDANNQVAPEGSLLQLGVDR